jgi:flagellar protein FlaJ
VLIGGGILTGEVSTTWEATLSNPFTQTLWFVYLPATLIIGGYGIFYEWEWRQRHSITAALTGALRQLANANEAGQPFLSSLQQTAEGTPGQLGDEFLSIYHKVRYGQSMSDALVEFNNKYRLPRLARIVKLVQKGQEVSGQVTPVLDTAAQLSETQDTFIQKRKQQARIQSIMIGIAFIVCSVGLILGRQYVFGSELMTSLASNSPATAQQFIDTIYLHAITMYALVTGGVTGFLYTGNVRNGSIYAVIYLLVGAGPGVVLA